MKHKKMPRITAFYKKICLLCIALFALIYAPLMYANKLDILQSQIELKEKKISAQKKQKETLEAQLNQQEQDIKILTQNLKITQSQTHIYKQKITQSEQRLTKLSAQQKQQNDQLNQLAKKIYHMENTSFIKQVLSEQDPKKIRIKQFLKKLYRQQNEGINQLKTTQEQIKQEQSSIKQQLKEQKKILIQQEQQQKALEQKKQEHLVTLNKLKEQLSIDQQQLANLRKNEDELRQKIEKAQKQDEERNQREKIKLTAKGLGKPHKQYQKPVKGEIIHFFGNIQMGELRWKGIVIKASQGLPVTAIADGRVILANYLQGYGLMVIIKHGKNDLSLYGYNQELLVKAGDIVLAGQKIASVGYVQGKPYTGTYFEISRKGNPINPIGWLK